MTNEEMDIAVAKACGRYVHFEGTVPYESKDSKPNWDHRVYQNCPLRNFTGDLNACHEMEKVLQDRCLYWPDYVAELVGLVTRAYPHLPHQKLEPNYSQSICATAAQRCEAFLRCLGKWKEES